MAAFESLLKIPAVHPVEVLFDPDDGSVILAQRSTPNGPQMVVQIPSHAIERVANVMRLAALDARLDAPT